MATLREVAREAGVSLATASRVAAGSGAVRDETRRRVEDAMRDLLYVPPRRGPATGAVGLLVPELGNPVFPALAQRMEGVASAAGLATILCNTTGAAFREVEYVHMLLDRRVEGMIFISCEMTNLEGDHAHYARLVAEGARLVFVNGALDEIPVPSVGVDEEAAGCIAARHLLELGHRRIGFAAGHAHYLPTREKAAGVARAVRDAGLPADAAVVAHADFSLEGGRDALAALLAGPGGPPTGVLCSSDLMAVGVLQEARSRGLRVPEDLSVVGFDGIPAAAWLDPPLTTVEQPLDEIAQAAVDVLRSVVADPGRAVQRLVFRPRLRPGGSTAAPPAH